MNQETKAILKKAINDFLIIPHEKKDIIIENIKNDLEQAEYLLFLNNKIGYAKNNPCLHWIQASKIFLRIYK